MRIRHWLVIFFIIFSVSGLAEMRKCTDADHISEEQEASNLRSWSELHAFYIRYGRCEFDADAAEGYSESVARILVDNWPALSQGAKFMANDLQFRKFIFDGINETLNPQDLISIRSKSTTACPKKLASLCSSLHKRTELALAKK